MSVENDQDTLIPRKTIGPVLAFLGLIIVLLSVAVYFVYSKKSTNNGSEKVSDSKSLDEFVKSQAELLPEEEARKIGLGNKELEPQLKKKDSLLKITLVPKMLVGGDAVYEPVAETKEGFFVINEKNQKDLFVIETEVDALNYIDFIKSRAGQNSYDRARTTIWNESGYSDAGCKSAATGENFGLPKEKPVSQAKKDGDNFVVDWIYSTIAFPAGFYAERYLIDSQGNIKNVLKADKPFWSCGQGIMF